MPNDLLRYLAGPTGYSLWWWLLVGLLILAVAGWYAGVAVWTWPPLKLRSNKILGPLHRRLVADRFVKSVRATTEAHRAGTITPRQALAAYTRTLRSFLRVATGERSQYMQISELAAGQLAPAAPLVAAIDDTRFGTANGPVDVDRIGSAVEEAIRSWH